MQRRGMHTKFFVPSLIFLSLGFIVFNCESRITKLIKPQESDEAGIQQPKKKELPEKTPKAKKREAPEQQFAPQRAAIPQEFDIEAKRHDVEQLVEKAAVAFEKSKTLENIFNAITSDPQYQKGELYVFVYDFDCVLLASGQQTEMIWQNFYNYRDQFGSPVVRKLVESAKKGTGWVTYEWRGAIKVSLVKKVKKFGKEYVLGAGYYPFSKQDNVVSLVKGAVALFNQHVEDNRPIADAFAEFGYPKGRFVLGDLYIYSLIMSGPRKGEHVAHGERSGLIGVNQWNYRDASGKYVNQEIVEKLHASTEGVWVEYESKGAPKKAYAEKVIDKKGIEYLIACGYYPDANREEVIKLVDKGYAFMKAHGISQAASDFNNIDNPEYRYGDLYLFVFDTKGKCLAEGGNPQLVGTNMFDEKDEDGRLWVREIIEKAKDGGGWIDFKFKNSFKSIYAEMVDMGVEKLVIGSGTYPSTKMETMTLLAKSATGLLKTAKETKEAFAEFVKPEGSKFIRGDLSIFVFEKSGICFAYGDNHDLIWKNLSFMKDAEGRSLVSLFDEVVDKGPSKVMYTVNNNRTIAYIESLERDGITYIIGSSFIQ